MKKIISTITLIVISSEAATPNARVGMKTTNLYFNLFDPNL